MPRLARFRCPGVLHHVMGRGIEKNNIFLNKKDRNDFINRLSGLVDEGAIEIYAWALMTNHFI
jgi:REP element-mobilizing transposase RayT